MKFDYDLAVIGTGTAAYHVVNACSAAGMKLAVIDSRAYGGTCALRGCQPKKYLISTAEAAERVKALQGIGINGRVWIDWQALMASKNAFCDQVPSRTEQTFKSAGADTLHGRVKFTGTHRLDVAGRRISARRMVIATGAKPRPLEISGERHLTSSEAFLDLKKLPASIVFIGGGFISFEFAHVARQAGARVTILQRGDRVLKAFDPDLADQLVAISRDAGIVVHTQACVEKVYPSGSKLVAGCTQRPGEHFEADLIVHGAGRVADIDHLDLPAAEIDFSARGVIVNDYLQNPTNPSVYAIGDAAATPFQLATTADLEGSVAAGNILSGNHLKPDYSVVPSTVFTLPPLAAVGVDASQVDPGSPTIKINTGAMSSWPSSLRIGQRRAAYKIIQDTARDRILGAHILGHNADEVINIFALAIKFGLPASQLKQMLWAYPTYVSDSKYMIS